MKCVGSAKQAGFNLVELSLVLALILIMSSASLPKLAELYFKYQSTYQANQLLRFLQSARLFAITHYSSITVCPSLDNIRCSENWSQQIIAFTDDNKNSEVDGFDQILQLNPAISQLSVNRKTLHFFPVFSAANTTATLTLCLEGAGKTWPKALVVSNMGRVRLERKKDKISC